MSVFPLEIFYELSIALETAIFGWTDLERTQINEITILGWGFQTFNSEAYDMSGAKARRPSQYMERSHR